MCLAPSCILPCRPNLPFRAPWLPPLEVFLSGFLFVENS
jgi:hypothetical protein